MFISIDMGRDGCDISTRRWDITLSSRAWADDTLECWDAGAVAYRCNRAEDGRWTEKWLRMPFVAVCLVDRLPVRYGYTAAGRQHRTDKASE